MPEVNAIPVVGGPFVAGIGFVVLLLLAFTGTWAGALVTIAHEGGHYAVAILMGYSPSSLRLEDDGSGGTGYDGDWWSPGRILRRAAGLLIPRIVWHGAFTVLAVYCAWVGGRAMLGF